MKKIYEAAEMSIVLFDTLEVIVASGVEAPETTHSHVSDDNETEIV